MKPLILIAAILVTTSSATLHGAISTQYHTQDHHGQYSYGYHGPLSSASESKSHDGVTKGSYSYVDGYGHVQSVHYTADPHTGFHAVGTNLPQAPHPVNHGHLGLGHYGNPVPTNPHGVPVDTPEVAHAKAQHLAAHAAARAQAHAHPHHLYKRAIYGSAPWSYPQHVPVIHNGVPVEPPEVQEAKAAHFAAHARANGAPIDTPEVQHAKQQHFAAHAAAARSARPEYNSPSYHNPAPAYHHPAPSYHSNHIPSDTPEVAHAKSQHYAALARAGPGPSHSSDYHHQPAPYQGPIHIPVIQNGVPVEPEEVQHARSAHLNALASAATHSSHSPAPYDGNYGPNHYDDGSYRPEYDTYTN